MEDLFFTSFGKKPGTGCVTHWCCIKLWSVVKPGFYWSGPIFNGLLKNHFSTCSDYFKLCRNNL
jgi:hypothetical protein